jgi:hypothetical protein
MNGDREQGDARPPDTTPERAVQESGGAASASDEQQTRSYDDPWQSGEDLARTIENEWRKSSFRDKLHFWFNALVLLVAVLAAGGAIGQMRAANQAIIEARSAASRQDHLTRQAARAWILFEDRDIDNPDTKVVEGNTAQDSSITVFVRNFGQSAAYDVTWKAFPLVDCAVTKGSPREQEVTLAPSSVVLPPGRLLRLSYYYPTGRKLGDRENLAFVVKYHDQYRRTIRTTIFCVQGAFDYGERDKSVSLEQGHDYAD